MDGMLYKLLSESVFIIEDEEKEVKLTKRQIEKLVKEWTYLESQMAVFAELSKRMSKRSTEIQDLLLPIVKAEEEKAIEVKKAIVQYNSRKVTSIKYQKAFERALEIVNDEQKAFLEDFKESVTQRGISEKINIVDPELAILVKRVAVADTETLIELLPKVKAEAKEIMADRLISEQGRLASAFSAVANLIKKSISGLTSKLKSSKIAVHQLSKVAEGEE